MNNNELIAAVAELEQGIGLQNGFFIRLVAEDDWSFVIKIHALYEAAVTKLITEKVGEKVGPNDLLIASIVKFHDGILVTNNVKEFKRIKGLKIENWVK